MNLSIKMTAMFYKANLGKRLKTWVSGIILCASYPLMAAPEKPNIVLIMVDDMGYSDISPYGGEIETPHLATLAKQGLRFTQFYNFARCCPTRAALMTGLQPHQVGVGHMVRESGHKIGQVPAAYQGNLNEQCVTLAEVAKSAGYATFMTGKWHLSGNQTPSLENQINWPRQRGFDRFYGALSGANHYFEPFAERLMMDGNTLDPKPKSTTERRFYTTDAFADHAIRFLEEHESSTQRANPFFLYLAFTAPHWPLHAHDEELAKYRGKYRQGWDKIREARWARQQELGLIPKGWKLTPRDPEVPAWDSLDAATQDACDHRMAAYAAMIDRVDQKIGDLINTLKKSGEFENTLILFLSDNGACAEGSKIGGGDPLADRAPQTPLMKLNYGKAWANASATPYQQYKHFAHEGGANTPFLAHWPAQIKAGRDWFREPAQLIDVMATVLDLTGATYPKDRLGKALPALEGVSLRPAFEGKSLARKSALFMEHEDNAFVREGKWKLVGKQVAPARGLNPQRWELYNMEQDGTETNNVAVMYPEKVQALSAQWDAWAQRVGVYPKPFKK
jgi:arylsulfatase A-like enzyme